MRSPSQDSTRGRHRVLVVDPEESTQRTCVRLGLRGYRVDVQTDALQALVALRAARLEAEPYRVVILDPHQAGLDSRLLVDGVSASSPTTAVLLGSHFGGDPLVRDLTEQHGAAFLAKPFNRGELLAVLHQLSPPRPPPRPARSAPQDRQEPAVLSGAYALLRLEPGADAVALLAALRELDGLCYCEALEGRWDLLAFLQAPERAILRARLDKAIEVAGGVAEHELLETRIPLLQPELWPLLVDHIAARELPLEEEEGREAFVILEVEPERLSEAFLRAALSPRVVHCDAVRDGAILVLLVCGWPVKEGSLRVPDALRMLPGVLRARALPLISAERKRELLSTSAAGVVDGS